MLRAADGRPGFYFLEGEVDLTHAATVEDLIRATWANGRLALDLNGLKFIDSAGLRMLSKLHEEFDLALVISPDAIARRTIEIVSLPELVPIFDSAIDAGLDDFLAP
ncbi:hypothetical protein BH18ACT5_BH18ACT5_02760 [soil metagenome]